MKSESTDRSGEENAAIFFPIGWRCFAAFLGSKQKLYGGERQQEKEKKA